MIPSRFQAYRILLAVIAFVGMALIITAVVLYFTVDTKALRAIPQGALMVAAGIIGDVLIFQSEIKAKKERLTSS